MIFHRIKFLWLFSNKRQKEDILIQEKFHRNIVKVHGCGYINNKIFGLLNISLSFITL